MSDKDRDKKKLEPALGLDMDFGEALERFAHTDPKQVEQSIVRSKAKKPPGGKKPKPSDGDVHADGVISLAKRRVRKRTTGK